LFYYAGLSVENAFAITNNRHEIPANLDMVKRNSLIQMPPTILFRFVVIAFLAFMLNLTNSMQAQSILGGSITWERLAGDQYNVSLNLYYDCYGSIVIGQYDADPANDTINRTHHALDFFHLRRMRIARKQKRFRICVQLALSTSWITVRATIRRVFPWD
jgi:hypothetical protein